MTLRKMHEVQTYSPFSKLNPSTSNRIKAATYCVEEEISELFIPDLNISVFWNIFKEL